MAQARILSVGQCGFDRGSLSRFFSKRFGAQVVAADTRDEALDALRSGPFDLVLVNRVADRDGSPGLELIRAIKSDPATAGVPVMLVSNYPDAQDQAVALGALPRVRQVAVERPRDDSRTGIVAVAQGSNPMKKDEISTPAGAEIIDALTEVLDALKSGSGWPGRLARPGGEAARGGRDGATTPEDRPLSQDLLSLRDPDG